MSYTIAGATIYGVYECKKCGTFGGFTSEGYKYPDETFGLMGFECPKCGADLDDEDEDE